MTCENSRASLFGLKAVLFGSNSIVALGAPLKQARLGRPDFLVGAAICVVSVGQLLGVLWSFRQRYLCHHAELAAWEGQRAARKNRPSRTGHLSWEAVLSRVRVRLTGAGGGTLLVARAGRLCSER